MSLGVWDAISDRPLATVVAVVVLAACAVGAGLALRALTSRTTSLRQVVLAITLSSIAIGAVVAVVLARLMVLDADQARSALGVLAATAVLAAVLAAVASRPLGRDAQRLESAVRRSRRATARRAPVCERARRARPRRPRPRRADRTTRRART